MPRTPDLLASPALRLSLESPEALRARSGGELRSAAGFDDRGRPVPGGLFCPLLFGAEGETCGCGAAGPLPAVLCALCGRPGARFAHLELAGPVVHPFFLRVPPSPIACLLGMPPRDLRRLLYGHGDVRAGEGERGLPPPLAAPGEALAERLRRVDLDARIEALRLAHAAARGGVERARARRQLRVLEALRAGGTSPERMLLRVVPVPPPALRPPASGPRDRNRLYAAVVDANLRLGDALGRGEVPDLWQARRALQRAVDRLFLHGFEPPRLAGAGSLAARTLGRRGALRVPLAPKRVAFSAALVVAPDPTLSPGECALPIGLARELYRPLVLARLVRQGELAGATAEGLTRAGEGVFDEALAAIVAERPLLVAGVRARTRCALRAFWPRLTRGEALGLAPLACAALGLEGGERVRLHVPLSVEACDDLAERMVWPAGASRQGGGDLPLPTPQARLGLAYATTEPRPGKGGLLPPSEAAAWGPTGPLTPARRASLVASALVGGMHGVYASFDEVRRAYDVGEVALHAALVLREGGTWFLTSAGRCLVGEALRGFVTFESLDRVLDQKALKALLGECRRRGGDHEVALAVERLERLGLELATSAGTSLCADDLRPPPEKAGELERARAEVDRVRDMYEVGLITDDERYLKIVDIWAYAADRVASALSRKLDGKAAVGGAQPLGLLVRAGLVSMHQAKRLSGVGGLTARRSGNIYERFLGSSFHEGYSPHEYFLEAGRARLDALARLERGAGADALLARLAACCADVVIEPGDCGSEGVEVRAREGEEEPLRSIREQAPWGRLLAADLPLAPAGGAPLARAGQPFDEATWKALAAAGVTSVRVRSPLACHSDRGICAACYGRPSGRRGLAPAGEAVGVIAAQSIGEAARRLLPRKYHIGGGSWSRHFATEIVASASGLVRLHDALPTPRGDGRLVVLGRGAALTVVDDAGRELAYEPLPQGALLCVAEGQKVARFERLAELDPYYDRAIAEADGVVRYDDLIEGVSVGDSVDTATGQAQRCTFETPGRPLRPSVRVVDEASGATARASGGSFEARYDLPPGTVVIACEGARVQKCDLLAKMPRHFPRYEGEICDLPKLNGLVDACSPPEPARLADITGFVSIERLPRGARRLTVTPFDRGEPPRSFVAPPERVLLVRQAERVRPGDVLVEGPVDPHDLLRIHGPAWLAARLADDIRALFSVSGELLDPRHVEVVVRQMLRFERVDAPGDTRHVPGDLVDRAPLERENAELARRGGRPASSRPALVGVARAARLRAGWLGHGRASSAALARAALAGASSGPLRRAF